jgi:hypothetical protein
MERVTQRATGHKCRDIYWDQVRKQHGTTHDIMVSGEGVESSRGKFSVDGIVLK